MKHKYLTAVFTLCLAVTITIIPVRASEVPQEETTEAAAEEVIPFAEDEITRTDNEGSDAADAQPEKSGDSVNEPVGAPQEEKTQSDGTVQEEVTQTDVTAQDETPQAEELAQEDAAPAEEPAQEEVTPSEEPAQEEVTPAEKTAQDETAQTEEPAREEGLLVEEAPQEDILTSEEALKDENTVENSTEDAETAAETGNVEKSEVKDGIEQTEVTPAVDQTSGEMNAAADAAAVAAGDTLNKQSGVSDKIRQMKLEVIDYKDNGYGDSQMLTSGGKRLLIDTYVKESWGTLNNWLKDHGYFNFDIYISHYHDDHMGNIRNILNDGKYKVSNLYLPDFSYMNGPSVYMQDYIEWCKRIINTAKDKGVKITYLNKGSSFNVGDVNATVLWGAQYKSSEHKRSYINNNSLVTRFTCGNTRYLNAGDIEAAAEKQILKAKVDVKADIFKMSHHGIDDTNTDAFLKAVGASFYYYNSLADSPSKYAASGSMSCNSARNAKKYGNVASVRYNGDITYTVYDDIISQELQRNYTEQKVYLYDKSDKKKLKGVVSQQLNKATTKRIDDRAYDGYSSASSKRDGTYAEDGWILGNEGKQYYYKNNTAITGWRKIDGSLYHFNTKTGKKDTGWKKYGKHTFYFDAAGRAQTGSVKIGKSWYYFDGLCRMAKSRWLAENGKLYYINANGTRRTGWLKKGRRLFYFEPNGALISRRGFVKIGKKIFYVKNDGSMWTGWLRVNGKLYYMNENGSRHTGWLKKGKKKFYFGSDGVLRAR